MRRPMLTLAVALAALPLSGLPASAITPEGFDCPPDDGREQLTTDGFQLAFEAPATPVPESGTSGSSNGSGLTPFRSARFYFRANFLPYSFGDLEMSLTWAETSDYDLYVYDAEGYRIAGSDASNIDGGDTRFEALTLEAVPHCADLEVQARNWGGRPDQALNLKIDFKNPGPAFVCELDDPHAACEGKLEGESPDRVADPRTRLYLGGDPGQASMVFETAGGATPFRATLAPERPTGGRFNQYTRPVVGFRDQYQNPFIPHFGTSFAEPFMVVGEAQALVWVSSPTLKGGGKLFVDLYLDGTLASSVEIPGAGIPETPIPLLVRFPDLEMGPLTDVGLQIGTEPAVSTRGLADPNDALFTVYYGSVQFPSRVTLPPPSPIPVEE